MFILIASFFLLMGFLAARILVMQVFSYDKYQQKVLNQVTTTSHLRARRGTIYDGSGNVLAESKTEWRVFLSPVDIRDCSKKSGRDYAAEISRDLSELLELPYDKIYSKASNSRVLDETILKRADEETYQKVISLIKEKEYGDMVHTETYYSRSYPSGDLFCHVLGFTGSDSQGLFGLEYQYDDVLAGTDGHYLYAKAANGNELPNQYIGYVPSVDGSSIVTTLDSYLQEQLLYQLNETKATYDAQNRVTGVVMNVQTGTATAPMSFPNCTGESWRRPAMLPAARNIRNSRRNIYIPCGPTNPSQNCMSRAPPSRLSRRAPGSKPVPPPCRIVTAARALSPSAVTIFPATSVADTVPVSPSPMGSKTHATRQ